MRQLLLREYRLSPYSGFYPKGRQKREKVFWVAMMKSVCYQTLIRHELSENIKRELHIH
jgi:hypothetical protein